MESIIKDRLIHQSETHTFSSEVTTREELLQELYKSRSIAAVFCKAKCHPA